MVYDFLDKFGTDPPQDFAAAARLFEIYKSQFLDVSAENDLIDFDNLAISGDGTPVYTGARERKSRTCFCLEKGIRDCKCNRITISRTATSDGIPIGIATTSAMTCTRLRLPTQKTIFPLSRSWDLPRDMTRMDSYITGSPCSSIFRTSM